MYESPPDLDDLEVSVGSVVQQTADEFTDRRHDLLEATQGKQTGYTCKGCKAFHSKKNINKWLTGKPCMVTATGKQRKAAFDEAFSNRAKAAREARESFVIFESDEEATQENGESQCKRTQAAPLSKHISKSPNQDDADEAQELK